jgi:hypothetical protein
MLKFKGAHGRGARLQGDGVAEWTSDTQTVTPAGRRLINVERRRVTLRETITTC